MGLLTFRGVLLCLGIALVIPACSDTNSVNPPTGPALTTPTHFPIETAASSDQPMAQRTDTAVVLSKRVDPLETVIELPNADAEAATEVGMIATMDTPSGLSTSGDCAYKSDGVSPGNGQWRFELHPGCAMLFAGSSLEINQQAITVDLDAQSSADQPAKLFVEILAVSPEAIISVLESRLVTIGADEDYWQAVQLIADFDSVPFDADTRVGVRITNNSESAVVSADEIQVRLFSQGDNSQLVFSNDWNHHCDQLWAGRHFWSNRTQDWHVKNQRLEIRLPDKHWPKRTTHRITTRVVSAPEPFSLRVDTGPVDEAGAQSYSGFLIGAGGKMNYQSSALIHNRHGLNGGIIAGVNHLGQVFIKDNDIENSDLAFGEQSLLSSHGVTLQLDANYLSNGKYVLNLYAIDQEGVTISSTTTEVDAVKLLGNIALISTAGNANSAYWFDNWTGTGSKLREMPSRQLGPVLFASYTVSNTGLVVNAQYPPLCTDHLKTPSLQVYQNGNWNTVASAAIDPNAYTARFSVGNWDSSQAREYRIVTESNLESTQTIYYYGLIQKDPVDEPEFVMGLYNCRPGIINSKVEGWIQQNSAQPFTWTRDRIVFPHEELISNSQQHNPHIVAFVGDQLYEFDPTGHVEKHSPNQRYDYLWKWYQFGWSARELMRSTPSFVLPDDHDVYQGNLWGQNGVAAETEESGGYVYPADFVNMVQKTQLGSLPKAVDNAPIEQEIDVYFTNLTYGGVGIAVLEDRKFKSGPFTEPEAQQLLGPRQLAFLNNWAENWQGQTMKLAVSQSPFSQATTHSGESFNRMQRDWDSNGWPKSGRDKAVSALRKAYAPHISGDQHLGATIRHGVENQNDAIYSFAGPSMLNIFPRIWDPNNTSNGPGTRGLNVLGEFTDQHNNLINVLAVANPNVYYDGFPTQGETSKNDLGIGYGMVNINKPNRQYTFEAWPANISPLDPTATPYPDWPITFEQTDNDGRIPSGYLNPRVASVETPIVKVFSEPDNQLVYARRYPSARIELPVFNNDVSYRVELSDDDGYFEQFVNQQAQ